MSYFAAVVVRAGDRWRVEETDPDGCESLDDLGDLLRDEAGEVRLLVIEQDDEYAAIVRLDVADDDPRAFLSDGHAADRYPMAALVAEDLAEVGVREDEDPEDADGSDDDDLGADTPPVHDSAPFGDPAIVEDLGTPAAELLALCAHEGTLPVDVLVAVCGRAGCGDDFEQLHG